MSAKITPEHRERAAKYSGMRDCSPDCSAFNGSGCCLARPEADRIAQAIADTEAEARADERRKVLAAVCVFLRDLGSKEDSSAAPTSVQEHKGAFHEGGASVLGLARKMLRDGTWEAPNG